MASPRVLGKDGRMVPSGLDMLPLTVAGSVYIPPGYYPGTAVSSRALNLLHFTPFYLPGLTINRLSLEITVAGGAGALCRMGWYSNNDGVPGKLLAETAPGDASALGVLELAHPDLVITDWAWAACIFSATTECRSGSASHGAPIGTNSLQAAVKTIYSNTAYGPLPANAAGPYTTTGTGVMMGARKV